MEITQVGEYGVAITLIIAAVLIIRTVKDGVLTAMNIWRDVSAKRIAADERIAGVLDSVELRLGETKTIVDGSRRNQERIIGSLGDENFGLATIAARLDNIPATTAQAVQKALVDDFNAIGDKLTDMRNQVNAALTEWQGLGAKMHQYMTAATVTAKKSDAEQPEQGAEKPEPAPAPDPERSA